MQGVIGAAVAVAEGGGEALVEGGGNMLVSNASLDFFIQRLAFVLLVEGIFLQVRFLLQSLLPKRNLCRSATRCSPLFQHLRYGFICAFSW